MKTKDYNALQAVLSDAIAEIEYLTAHAIRGKAGFPRYFTAEECVAKLKAAKETLAQPEQSAPADAPLPAGVNVYRSASGWGFTGCDSDSYASEEEARAAAIYSPIAAPK